MYLLDTNVLSELRKGAQANSSVRAWAESTPASAFWISTITVLELEIGVLRIERRDAAQGIVLRQWLEDWVLKQFSERMIGVNLASARQCARLHIPNPRPERDALIAATALVHGWTVVTRDTADFAPMGVTVFNPWQAQSA